MQIITYHTQNPHTPDQAWLAYVVLPNGELWNVRFNGATEEIARIRAEALWSKEQFKISKMVDDSIISKQRAGCMESGDVSGLADKRGAHFIGKVWMINEATREKRRIMPEDVEALGPGWVKGGPRSR